MGSRRSAPGPSICQPACKGTLAHKPPTTPWLAAHFWRLIEASAVPGREPPSRKEQRQVQRRLLRSFLRQTKAVHSASGPEEVCDGSSSACELQVPQQRVFDGVDLTGQEGVSSSRSTEV